MTPTGRDDDRGGRSGSSRARLLFDELVELAVEARAARLEQIAGEDPRLADLVRELLVADAAAPRSFAVGVGSTDLVEVLAPAAPLEAAAGSRIGPYRLISPLGQGGMGEVWRAERADGEFEQQVALKLVRSGLESRELVRRFLLERQILARLEHPGIARLIDGGVSEQGRPYFALELVEGEPITRFVAARELDIDARLRLVLQAADAVAAAHAALVVHRDLKPSNILVGAGGRVKLLDFGIAKLLDPGPDEPAMTRTAAAPMTPAYAAPELLRGEPATTATDVFGLGAVLYELLAGRPPFPRRGASPSALAEAVARETLERPSRVVADRPGGARLARRLAGDLDTIVAKALHAEPGRRYPSIDAFAEDLRRYLDGRPVLARPDSLRYRLGKRVRRNRAASAAALLTSAALVAGLGAVLWQGAVARAAARRAEAEAAHARRVQELLVGLFEGADPSRTLGSSLTARQVLDEGVRRLPRTHDVDPVTRAEMYEVFARTYRSLGLLDDARRFAAQAVSLHRRLEGAASIATAEAELTAAEVAVDRGVVASTRPELTVLLARFDQELGADSPQALRARSALAQDYEAVGEGARARGLLNEVVDADRRIRGEDAIETIDAMAALADALGDASQFDRAERLLRDARARLERSGAARSPQAVRVETDLADVLSSVSRHDEAETLYREALAKSRAVLGPRHVYTAEILIKLGFLLSNTGRYDEADAPLREAASILKPIGHYDYGAAIRYLGYNELARERFAEAVTHFDEAESFFRATLGDDSPLTWSAVVSKAVAEMRTDRVAAAERHLREAIAATVRLLGPESDSVRTPLVALGEALRREGRTAEAIATHEKTLAMAIRLFGEGETLASAASRQQLAEDHLRAGSRADLLQARTYADASLAYFRAHPKSPSRLARVLVTSARVALAAGDRARARRELAEAVPILAASLPAGAPSLVEARALLVGT